MKNKNILIVGGTGFIGYHLAKKCIKLNSNVTILSLNKVKNFRRLKKAKYKVVDISDFKKLKLILKPKNFDFVVNLGGYVNHQDKKN